jgi:hypothetical protein
MSNFVINNGSMHDLPLQNLFGIPKRTVLLELSIFHLKNFTVWFITGIK